MEAKFNTVWPIILIFVFAGCVSTPSPPITKQPRITNFNLTELNQEISKELGDTLILQGEIHVYDAIKIEENFIADTFGIKAIGFEAGQELINIKHNPNFEIFVTEQASLHDSFTNPASIPGGLAFSKTDPNDIRCYYFGYVQGRSIGNRPIFSKHEVQSLQHPGFKQEIIYNGKVGNNIKLLYREFSNDFIRGSFNQEVQYDLTDSMTIGYKGARIQVIEANNQQIKYKITKTFDN